MGLQSPVTQIAVSVKLYSPTQHISFGKSSYTSLLLENVFQKSKKMKQGIASSLGVGDGTVEIESHCVIQGILKRIM